ncbi:MAG TPA: alpha/beta hydrolase [Alphaproteobacteria bacterium]|nr:alpha/beta hydrolase [Alphaproteobacteria bacterium]
MAEGLRREFIETEIGAIHAVIAGEGPPLLMLHGYPQTHVMWFRIAPALAERFTVVLPDLRGYGDSAKPHGDPRHETYSKRAMAGDQIAVMEALGFDTFQVVGHDRGARVAHRMALDHPEKVERLALLDIIPTLTLFETVNQEVASGYYHWFFLIQPDGLPEHMIGRDPDFYLRQKLAAWNKSEGTFSDAALAEYLRCFRDPAMIHASCEDYRAGASIDLEHDRADRDRRIGCPTLVLWGAQGLMGRHYDVLGIWREKAVDVRGQALDCGHFLAEERPEETYDALIGFLDGAAVE